MQLTDGVGRYQSDMRCEWKLSGSGTIELVVSLMVLEADYGSGDALRVYDGPDSSWPLIATLDGVDGDLPPPIRSSGGAMTVVFTSDEAWQREGFVATVRLVAAPTPSPTHVGDTWAPTTPTPTGPCTCTRECLHATHGTAADRCGCDRDEHERRRDVELELRQRLSKHHGRVQCCGAKRKVSQLHRSGRPAAERTGDAVVQGPHHPNVLHMRCIGKPVAAILDLHFRREAEAIGVQKHAKQRNQRQPGGACDAPAAGDHVRAHHHPQ
jgi:hypothetical protein